MDRNDPTPRYTRRELLEVLELGAEVAVGCMQRRPEDVEELSTGLELALEEFDIRRGHQGGEQPCHSVAVRTRALSGVQRAEEEVRRAARGEAEDA